jgi:signal transduction histidine kinase
MGPVAETTVVSFDPAHPEFKSKLVTAYLEDRIVIDNDMGASVPAEPWRQIAYASGVRSAARIPIRRSGKAIGVLSLNADEPGFFDSEMRVLLEGLVTDISHALNSFEYERRREQAEQALRALSKRLVETQEQERSALARELHDRIGQNIATLNLNLSLMHGELPAGSVERVKDRLQDCETLLDQTGQLVRNIMNDLRPAGLEELGLVAALQEHTRQLAKRSGLAVSVRGAEVQPRLPAAAETALFRIVQEALVNIVKHAQASECTVTMEADAEQATLTVADNGRGFDASGPVPLGHLGVVGMRERADAIGANLRVDSDPGAGTRVIVQVPRAAPASDR